MLVKHQLKTCSLRLGQKDKASKTKPTIGVEISPKFLEFMKEGVVISDFGGQTDYRRQHLEQEKIWNETSLFFHLILLMN